MKRDIEAIIDKKIGEVRTEALDMSFGELIGLHTKEELIISPDYQRLFRWTAQQQSRLIESILLELPIPQIFVVENPDGTFELVDGLQRLSSVIHFIEEPNEDPAEKLTLVGCDIITELNGLRFSILPQLLKNRLKRASVRVNVIKRQSTPRLRYEMFKRLNTGGSDLAPQEIRNCTARMLGQRGIEFYTFIAECASIHTFQTCISSLPDTFRETKGDEELVLRFFALKNAQHLFSGSVREWLDDYMDKVILDELPFDKYEEERDFCAVFDLLNNLMGEESFTRFRNNDSTGGLAPAYFEAITAGVYRSFKDGESAFHDARNKIIRAIQSDQFRACTGPGANSKEKLERRITIIHSAIMA